MNMTDQQQNQFIRPNIFGYDNYPSNVDWTRFQAGPGSFVSNIYNGYPNQNNVNVPVTNFPYFSQNAVNPLALNNTTNPSNTFVNSNGIDPIDQTAVPSTSSMSSQPGCSSLYGNIDDINRDEHHNIHPGSLGFYHPHTNQDVKTRYPSSRRFKRKKDLSL